MALNHALRPFCAGLGVSKATAMKPNLRARRDFDRARRTGAAVRARRGTAMDAALAQIGAAFGEAAAINAFKLRVERFLRLGPCHAAVRARYGAHAGLLTERNLAAAIILIERRWRVERKTFQIASALGCGSRLSLETLRELRLILRLLRFKRRQADFCFIVAALRAEAIAEAAE